MNFDHHNGKAVKSVRNHDGRGGITFEDGSLLDVPNEVPADLVGQSLLLVEDDKLIFGYTQPGQPAMRQTEIPIDTPQLAGQDETIEPMDIDQAHEAAEEAQKKPSKGRQSSSKGKNG